MAWKYVQIERVGRVAVVRFDRGDKLNALSLDLMQELIEVPRAFEGDLETSAVIITGSVSAFSSGLDLRDPQILAALQAPLGKRRHLMSFGPKMCRAWEEMEQVTIAAIEGHCIGGAVSLAVSCDFRIISRSGFFRVPELILGMNMSWQTLPRLVHLVGPPRAKQIVILGEKIAADTALNWGLAEEVAEEGRAVGRALTLAEKIADMPPLPVKMTKRAINALTNALDNAASHMDVDQFIVCQMTTDHAEGVASFLGKRKPSFKGE